MAEKFAEHLSIRLAVEQRAELEAAAKADRRPVTVLARHILVDWLAARALERAAQAAAMER
jgi:hypothetical protein